MMAMLDGEDLLHTDGAARAQFAPLLNLGHRLLQFGTRRQEIKIIHN